MGNVVGITAYLQAKNGLTPELEDVVKTTRKAAKEMLVLDDATQDMIKEMRKIKQVAEQNERGFKREFDQMQQEVKDLRRQLGILDSTRAHPKVSVDDQARREIAAIRQEVKALDGAKAKVQIEAAQAGGGGDLTAGGLLGGVTAYVGVGYLDQLSLETQANARRALIGDTPDELQQYQQQAQDLLMINPNVDRTYIKDLMTQATRFDNENGVEITKQALQLNAIRPDMGGVEEYQKAMFAMRQAYKDITDVGRFGDTLAEITRTTTDIRGEVLDSIVEYSTQVTKFLDTPEKLAALTKEMNDIWSIDKGFDALKETTLKLYNQGDLTNVLKTAYETQGLATEAAQKQAESEAKKITELINSGSTVDQQFAVGALMQQFGGIRDQKVLQNLLNELGAGPGEDLGAAMYTKLIEAAGSISTADASQFNYQGRLDQSFETFRKNDPLRDFLEAKAMLSNELIGLGTVIAQDISPVIKGLGDTIRGAKEVFDALPTWLALPALATTIGIVTYGFWKLKVALDAATAAAVRRSLGGGMPDFDAPGGPDKNRNGGGNNKPGKPGKRQWWNPLSWGGKNDPPTPKKNWLSPQEAADMAFGKGAPQVEPPKKTGWFDNLKKLGGNLPKGDAMLSEVKGAAEGLKPLGGRMLKRLPIIGTGIGVGIGASQILSAEDKLEMVSQLGLEQIETWEEMMLGATKLGKLNAKLDYVNEQMPPVLPFRRPIPKEALDELRTLSQTPVLGPPIPVVPPVKAKEEKPKLVSLSIPSMPITLKADGVLQDVSGMLRLLRDPAVSNEVKRIIEKAFLDALETRGGVAT